MISSFLAGICISLGAYAYLNIGGIIGAIFFSVGLLAILKLDFKLFTGRCGKLASREIRAFDLVEIWLGNFFGTVATAFCLIPTPLGVQMSSKAAEIVALRLSNGWLVNFLLGLGCGVLMYIAVTCWREDQPLYAIIPVACFILCGFNHCVADMFYLSMGMSGLLVLIPTTLGNFVGCNIIPGLQEE